MVVNEVRDFALFLHKNDTKLQNLRTEEYYAEMVTNLFFFVNGFKVKTYDDLMKWWSTLPSEKRQEFSYLITDFKSTSSIIGWPQNTKESTPLQHLISSFVNMFRYPYPLGVDIMKADRTHHLISPFSDGQLLAIYWYLLGH